MELLQYLPEDELLALKASILEAGHRATRDRPLARIGLEWNRDRTQVLLCLTSCPGLEDLQLAAFMVALFQPLLCNPL